MNTPNINSLRYSITEELLEAHRQGRDLDELLASTPTPPLLWGLLPETRLALLREAVAYWAAWGTKCPACNGAGEVFPSSSPDDYQECPECKGWGEVSRA